MLNIYLSNLKFTKMQFKIPLGICCLFMSLSLWSQNKLNVLTLDPDLKTNANAVVRVNTIEIDILAFNKMIIKRHRTVTVLNKKGERHVEAEVYYDNTVSVKKLEAKIYNAFGKEVKKFKKKDFIDVSVADGISIFNDDRAKFFDYTAVSYPYTVDYIEETVASTTAFIPAWYPIQGYFVSTEFASYKINNMSGIVLTSKATNFEDYEINKQSESHYVAKDLSAIRFEAYTPAMSAFTPVLKFALQEFNMKGVKGTNTDWKNFGKWVANDLNSNTRDLPESVKKEVQELTDSAETKMEKAKLIYEWMQEKTRYISVQVGIGGWRPMLASDVDKLGYGDCKALSNYTKALLEAVGIESYYTIIYGGRDIRHIDSSFSSQQGNHVILAIPDEKDLVFLECTSQTSPFGYNANFTDDRDVLIITPQGGEIVHTKQYKTEENLQESSAKIMLASNGSIQAELNIASRGTQYGMHSRIENENEKDQKLYYKERFDHINNLEVQAISLDNDKNDIVFTEQLKLSASKYGSKAGSRILLKPNLFNKKGSAPPRYENRHLPFEIDRGFTDVDSYDIHLPEGLEVEALMKSVHIENEFGSYSISIEQVSANLLVYKRKLVVNKGEYSKEDYAQFREFYLSIVKHDKSKIVLKPIS